MEKDEPRSRLSRLFEGKRHQPVQVAQVGGDQDRRRMSPSCEIRNRMRIWGRYSAWRTPRTGQHGADRSGAMCQGAPEKVT